MLKCKNCCTASTFCFQPTRQTPNESRWQQKSHRSHSLCALRSLQKWKHFQHSNRENDLQDSNYTPPHTQMLHLQKDSHLPGIFTSRTQIFLRCSYLSVNVAPRTARVDELSGLQETSRTREVQTDDSVITHSAFNQPAPMHDGMTREGERGLGGVGGCRMFGTTQDESL